MVQRIGGVRRKSRHATLKDVREKGKLSIRKYFQKFAQGESVVLRIDPAVQKGAFIPRRFQGKVGTVSGTQGKCYKVTLKDNKVIIVHPIHMVKVSA